MAAKSGCPEALLEAVGLRRGRGRRVVSCPETREELVDWFTRDPQRMPIEDIELLADRMIGTNRGRFHFLHEPEGMSVTEVWNMILEYDFLLSDRYGWLDRKGKLWGCSWGGP
jgi:hypothetical protein